MRLVTGVFFLALLAAGARVGGQQPPTPTPPAGGKNPPQSLAMGASKSRMTFFVTSKASAKAPI